MSPQLSLATWNVMRPFPTCRRTPGLNAELAKHNPDIVVLTETHECISPVGKYHVQHSDPIDHLEGGNYYKKGERRISIWTHFPIVDCLEVTNPHTTTCALVETPLGKLAVFGCIIGIHGIRDDFDTDLQQQIADLKQITKKYPVCYTGDFNLSFCDAYYTKKTARDQLNELFSTLKMKNLTEKIPETIDHIVVSESFFSEVVNSQVCWNPGKDKKLLSDHKGMMVTLRT